jgi:hypothetical protein
LIQESAYLDSFVSNFDSTAFFWILFQQHRSRSELLSFPAGKHDDCVDALGLIGQLLDRISVGNKPAPPAKAKYDNGYQPWKPAGRLDEWITY